MKILHIIDNIGLGGAQSIVKGIFEKQKNNKNIYLYSLRIMDVNINIAHENIYGNSSKYRYGFFFIYYLYKFIKKNNIDIIHCHLFKAQISGYLLKLLFFPNIKLIFHEHGSILKKLKVYPYLMSKFRKKIDLFIAISNATKKYLIKESNISESKIILLYNFVDLNKFSFNKNFNLEIERNKYGLKVDDFVVGFAGRLIKMKGWEDFIKSAKDLIKKGYNIKFIIAGDGNDKQKLLDEVEFEKSIIYVGHIKEMLSFYSILDIFVIPSYREAMGLTEIEAMSVGIPVISSNVEALNEIIEDGYNGLLFNVKDSNDLSKNILKLYNDLELRKKLIKNGKESVKRYNLDNYLVELEKIYEI